MGLIGGWCSGSSFCRIGKHSFIGGGFRVVQDVPPFILAAGEPLSFGGTNRIGLKRRGFAAGDRKIIKGFYQLFFRSELNRSEALQKIDTQIEASQYKDQILDFIRSSERGII